MTGWTEIRSVAGWGFIRSDITLSKPRGRRDEWLIRFEDRHRMNPYVAPMPTGVARVTRPNDLQLHRDERVDGEDAREVSGNDHPGARALPLRVFAADIWDVRRRMLP